MTVLRILSLLAVALCLFTLAMSSGQAADDKGVKVGDQAPVFKVTDDTGKPWKSADHVGKKVLVFYFFPADFTGGCTKQACSYRDDSKKLADKGIEVVGVSGDSAKTHEMFKKSHKLDFTLLADEKGEVAKKFGIPVTVGETDTKGKDAEGKAVNVKRGATIKRWTVVIGKDGKVAEIYEVKDAAGDSKQVLEKVK